MLEDWLATQSSQAAHSEAYGVFIKVFSSRRAYVEQVRLLVLICLALAPIIFLFRKKAPPELAAWLTNLLFWCAVEKPS